MTVDFRDIAFPHPATRWAVHVQDTYTQEVLISHNPHQKMPAASTPKLILMLVAAYLSKEAHLVESRADAYSLDDLLRREPRHQVSGTGIWQSLTQDTLPIRDIMRLIGTVSDNVATNVLIDHLGLGTIQQTASKLGIRDVHIHDIIRRDRSEEHPPQFSTATAAGLSHLIRRIAVGDFPGKAPNTTEDSLYSFVDTSMLAGQFQRHPLLTNAPYERTRIISKTGTDDLVASEALRISAIGGDLSIGIIVNGQRGTGQLTTEQFHHETRRSIEMLGDYLSTILFRRD